MKFVSTISKVKTKTFIGLYAITNNIELYQGSDDKDSTGNTIKR